MKLNKLAVLMSLAAIILTACQSGGNSQVDSSMPSNTVQPSSSACKLMADYGGHGKNIVYRCNISAVLRTADAQSALKNNVPVSYGYGGQLRTNATARSFARNDAASCERAVINAINNLQNPRKAKGAVRRVTNVSSYAAQNNGRFNSGRMAPVGQADCIVATFQSHTVMRGTPRY